MDGWKGRYILLRTLIHISLNNGEFSRIEMILHYKP